MNYCFRRYYARSGLNPNKRDKPEQPKEEPELIRKIRRYSGSEPEKEKQKDTNNQ